ncbi:MAG: YccF domain-containing protein [Anaerolineaceae bacterium]
MTENQIQPVYAEEVEKGPGLIIRILYFIVFGLEIGAIWTAAAWVLIVTVIGMPLGLLMLNRLPQIMTLKPMRSQRVVEQKDGRWVMRDSGLKQRPFLGRAIYFVLIGWWFSLVWLGLAWLISGVTLGLGLPLSFWMFEQVPAITTLARL